MRRFITTSIEQDSKDTRKNRLPIGSIKGLSKFVEGCDLDPGIGHYVAVLRSQDIETCQSCQGGPGHAYLEPTIDFHGDKAEGPRAVAAAFAHGLPVSELRRVWNLRDGELDGPLWQITFTVTAESHLKTEAARVALYLKRKKTGRDFG
jgi:hypothetical protein